MEQTFRIVTSCVLLLFAGCAQQTASDSVSVGPFSVNSETGIAEGQAFGISFRAMGASSPEVKFDLSGNAQHSSSSTITLADDLTIDLKTMNENDLVAFQLNGKEICSLTDGDEVVIDEERNVTVNGDPPRN